MNIPTDTIFRNDTNPPVEYVGSKGKLDKNEGATVTSAEQATVFSSTSKTA